MTLQNWLADNAVWVFPLIAVIGGMIGFLAKLKYNSQKLKNSEQELTKGIIDRLRTENSDLKTIIQEKNAAILSQIANIAQINNEKSDMLQRIYKYQDNEIQFTKQIQELRQKVNELTSQVELLTSMFPELKNK